MTQAKRPAAELQTLTEQELAECETAYRALSEQVSRTEAPPEEQVRMRLARWILETGLETHRADLDLLDRLCRQRGAE